jgi:hypothetical protein
MLMRRPRGEADEVLTLGGRGASRGVAVSRDTAHDEAVTASGLLTYLSVCLGW